MKSLSLQSRSSPVRFALLVLALAFASAGARADDWAPNITTTGVWHSNATNSTGLDQLDSLQLKADLLASQRYTFGRVDTVHLSGHGGVDWWPRYNGLMTGALGARAEWRHSFGVTGHSPVFSIEGAADAIGAKETGRRGVSTGVTAALRKRFNDLTRGMIAHEVSWMDARYGTYDRTASETTVELDRDLTDVSRLTLTARYRDGDVVSYAQGTRPDLEALAPNRIAVETFGRPMTAYRIDARTWSARIAYVRALDPSSAIIVGYEWRDTKRKPLAFTNHLLSVALVHQF